jgi:hypothetical protein
VKSLSARVTTPDVAVVKGLEEGDEVIIGEGAAGAAK